jgi:hypothetical protein
MNRHSEYVIFIVFPLQQWLHEHALVLHYMHIAYLVLNCIYMYIAVLKFKPSEHHCQNTIVRTPLSEHHSQNTTVRTPLSEHRCRNTAVGTPLSEHHCQNLRSHNAALFLSSLLVIKNVHTGVNTKVVEPDGNHTNPQTCSCTLHSK